jgi:hypothetical protein
MSKQPHVPETRQPKPNREQRRHPEKTPDAAQKPRPETQDEVLEQHDVPPVENTADTWNQ